MVIQEQLGWNQINDDTLSFFKAIGVDYLTVNPIPAEVREGKDMTDLWREIKYQRRHRIETMYREAIRTGRRLYDREITEPGD